MNSEQREEIIDQYCDWFVKGATRETLELIAWDSLHEDLHSLSAVHLTEIIKGDCPELLGGTEG
jgi:hypothetical protein